MVYGRPVRPYDWERYPAFRSTFLYHFTQEGDREAFEHLGRLLYDMALGCSGEWPDWPETPTKAEMRAVALDLRHAAAYLATVGGERTAASLALEDERLALMAERWAVEADRIGAEIEAVLKSREEG